MEGWSGLPAQPEALFVLPCFHSLHLFEMF